MALTVGPKHCDLEVREYRTRKAIGRIALDLLIKHIQTIEITLNDLVCQLNYKEEKPLFGQFKLVSSRDDPALSEQTYTQIGKFSKEENTTTFWWYSKDDEFYLDPTLSQEVSLDSLKKATLQLQLKVDPTFSQTMHAHVM